MKNVKKLVLSVGAIIVMVSLNTITFAGSTAVDAPTLTQVRSIVGDALDLFFGALAAFAVITGGIEFYKAFLSFKDSKAKGGYGASKSDFVYQVLAGILCIIGAVIIFVVLSWSKDLFNI